MKRKRSGLARPWGGGWRQIARARLMAGNEQGGDLVTAGETRRAEILLKTRFSLSKLGHLLRLAHVDLL